MNTWQASGRSGLLLSLGNVERKKIIIIKTKTTKEKQGQSFDAAG